MQNSHYDWGYITWMEKFSAQMIATKKHPKLEIKHITRQLQACITDNSLKKKKITNMLCNNSLSSTWGQNHGFSLTS